MYDEDEIISSQVATSMCQRGFENLFMLSGGEVSCFCASSDHPVWNRSLKSPLLSSSLCPSLQGLKVIAQKFPSGMVTGSFPASCLSSPASKSRKCSASQQLAQTAERRWRFTFDELTKIQEQLEEMLLPTTSNSNCLHYTGTFYKLRFSAVILSPDTQNPPSDFIRIL